MRTALLLHVAPHHERGRIRLSAAYGPGRPGCDSPWACAFASKCCLPPGPTQTLTDPVPAETPCGVQRPTVCAPTQPSRKNMRISHRTGPRFATILLAALALSLSGCAGAREARSQQMMDRAQQRFADADADHD